MEFWLICLQNRDSKNEGTAISQVRFCPDHAPMGLNKMLGNCQAQPGSTAAAGFIGFIKALENPDEIVRWNSFSGIFDGELNMAVLPGNTDINTAAGWGELDGVVNEINKDLLYPAAIRVDLRQVWLAFHCQVNAGAFGLQAQPLYRFGCQLAGFGWFEFE